MKLAVVSGWECVGGAEMAATRLCDALQGAVGVQIQRFVGRIDRAGSRATKFTHPGLPRRVLGDVSAWLNGGGNWLENQAARRSHRRNLVRLLEGYGPDVIHLHSINSFSGVALCRDVVADLCEIAPVVWTLHDLWPLTGCCDYLTNCHQRADCGWTASRCAQNQPAAVHAWHGRGDKDIQRGAGQVEGDVRRLKRTFVRRQEEATRLLACGRRLVFACPSRWMGDAAEQVFAGRLRVVVIPNGLDTGFYRPLSRADARRALDLPEQGLLVLAAASRLSAVRKGMPFLLDAFRLSQGAWRPVLMGHASPEEQSAWPDGVAHLGELSDARLIRLAYAAADAVVVPSLADNLPNVLIEALACGRPCIGFRVGGIPEVIREDVTGALAPPGDSTALAAAIDSVLVRIRSNPCTWQDACRRVAVEEYDVHTMVTRYMELFHEAASRT